MSAELKASRHESSLILTISHPGRNNALHPDIAVAAVETLATAERDASVASVILTGAGTTFCGGTDLHRLHDAQLPDAEMAMADLNAMANWIEAVMDCPKPVIAAVEGEASGTGFSLALACDLIVAGTSARFEMPQTGRGVPPDGGASWLVARALPRHLAARTLLLGRPLDAQQLSALGVIGELVPDGNALETALLLAEDLANRSREAVQRTKLLLREAYSCGLATQIRNERQHFLESLRHQDAAEGIQAALEERTPSFR